MSLISASEEVDRLTALTAQVLGVPWCGITFRRGDTWWAATPQHEPTQPWSVALSGPHSPQHYLDGLTRAPASQPPLPLSNPFCSDSQAQPLRFIASQSLTPPADIDQAVLWLLDTEDRPDLGDTHMAWLQSFAKLLSDTVAQWGDHPDLSTREHLQLALDSAQMGTWDFNFETHTRFINQRTAHMLGFAPEDVSPSTLETWVELIHPDDLHKFIEASKVYVRARSDIISIEYRIRHRHGHYIWVQSYGKLVERDQRGRPKRVVGTLRDITEQKRREVLHLKQRQVLDLINLAQATFLVNHEIKDTCEALISPLLHLSECRFGAIGIVRHTQQGQPYLVVPTLTTFDLQGQRVIRATEYQDLHHVFGRVVTSNNTVWVDEQYPDLIPPVWPVGVQAPRQFMGLPIRFDNEVVGFIGLGDNEHLIDHGLLDLLAPLISTLGTLIHARHQEEARMEAEQEWLRLATEDTLTGLPNRRHFFDVAEASLMQTRRYGNPMTVALLDLDNFKQINDTYGHHVGDEVLRVMADILRQTLRDADTPARIGGEEFAIVLSNTSLADSVIALERIRATLSLTPVRVGGKTLHATVSIGAVQWRADDHEHVHGMLMQADAALYRAKRRGRNRVEVYDPLQSDGVPEPAPDTSWGMTGLA